MLSISVECTCVLYPSLSTCTSSPESSTLEQSEHRHGQRPKPSRIVPAEKVHAKHCEDVKRHQQHLIGKSTVVWNGGKIETLKAMLQAVKIEIT